MAGFITISILLIGCTGGSTPNVKSNPKDGLVDTPEETQRIVKLVNSQSNVISVFNNILKIQGTDKYESNADYLKRMSEFTTYAVMELDISNAYYSTERQLYMVPIGISDTLSDGKDYAHGWRCTRGTCDTTGEYFSEYRSLALSQSSKTRISHYTGSNAYGASTRVTSYSGETYDAHLDNIAKLLNSKSMHLAGDGYDKKYFVGLPVSKEKAKYLDNNKKRIKTKIRVQPVKMGTSLYRSAIGSEATIDAPVEFLTSIRGLDAHLKEFVIYDDSTKEILFQFAD